MSWCYNRDVIGELFMCDLTGPHSQPMWDSNFADGILRHQNMNLSKVLQLGGMNLGFRPSQLSSKGYTFNYYTNCATYLSACLPTTVLSHLC